MMRAFCQVIIWAIVALAVSHGAQAQERYALLIGNNDYSAKLAN